MSKEKWNNYKSQSNEKRSKMLTVRLTPTDLELVKNGAKICDMSTSDFVMNLLRQKEFEEFVCMREHEKYKELDRQTSIDSPAKESVNAKKRADEKNASRQGLNKNKSKGQRNR